MELRFFRAATYCRVSIEQDEQTANLESQKLHYIQPISKNPSWECAGIFQKELQTLVTPHIYKKRDRRQ